MENNKLKNSVKIAVAIIAILLVSSTLMVYTGNTGVPTASAQTSTSTTDSTRTNPITGKVYGDLSQYEWPRSSLTFSQGDTPSMAKSSGGPAPSRWNVMWSLAEVGYSGTIENGLPQNRTTDLGYVTRGIPDMLMGGWIFLRSTTGTITGYTAPSMFGPGGDPIFGAGDRVDYVNALDPYTGALQYRIKSASTPAQVDATHFRLTQTIAGDARWSVYEAKSGNWVYNASSVPGGTIIPESHIIVTTSVPYQLYPETTNTSVRYLAAWDIAGIDVGNINVTAKGYLWKTQIQRDLSAVAYGDGVLFYGDWYDNEILAFDARNGTIIWRRTTQAVTRDGLYYNGKLYTSALKRDITTYNGTTGEIVWTWQGGIRTYFSNTGAAGDGMFFDKAVDTPAGFVGCWDDATGELRWKIPGYYYIGYFSTFYDDGKVYAILQDNRGLTETEIASGKVKTLSACIDAMTGQILYTMPFELGHDVGAVADGFRGDVAIAYGVLFVEYYNILYCISDIQTPKDWPMYRGYLTQNAVDVTGSGPADISYPKWSFKTGAYVSATPAVAEGRVFVGSQDGKIYCLDAYTGALIWNVTTGYRVQASCAYSGGKVYTGADDGIIRCLDATDGSEVWSKDIGGKWAGSLEFYTASTNDPASSPIIVGDKLYVGAKDGKVYCLNTANGNIVWSTATYGPILGSPCYYNGVIFISSTDLNYAGNGGLYALDAVDGGIHWHVTVGGGRTGMASTPMIAETIFSNTSTNRVNLGPVLLMGAASTTQIYSFNITSGARNKFWTGSGYNSTNWFISQIATSLAGTPFTWTPAVYNSTVFGSGGLTSAAWNYTSGRVIWSQWLTHNVFVSPLVTSKGYKMDDAFVYYGADSGALSRLNANNASAFPISAFQGLGLAGSSFAMWEQKLYVGHGDYNVYCFDNSPSIPLTLFAAQDKPATMWSNETLLVSGRLNAEESFDVAADPALGVFEPISEKFKPGVANATITIVFVRPDLSSTNVTVLTDKRGYFTTAFNPDIVGTWSWTAWYQGKEFPNHSYRYDEAYSEYTSVEVTSPTAGGGAGETTPTATPTGPGEGVPMEYVYAAIAAIAIVLIAIGAYAYMKRGKKPTA